MSRMCLASLSPSGRRPSGSGTKPLVAASLRPARQGMWGPTGRRGQHVGAGRGAGCSMRGRGRGRGSVGSEGPRRCIMAWPQPASAGGAHVQAWGGGRCSPPPPHTHTPPQAHARTAHGLDGGGPRQSPEVGVGDPGEAALHRLQQVAGHRQARVGAPLRLGQEAAGGGGGGGGGGGEGGASMCAAVAAAAASTASLLSPLPLKILTPPPPPRHPPAPVTPPLPHTHTA